MYTGKSVENKFQRLISSSLLVQQGTCVASGSPMHGAMSGVVHVTPEDEQQLKQAVATAGPVVTTVDATSNAFRVSYIQLTLSHHASAV